MIQIRKSDDRGISQMDWLKSLHTFSFAQYRDPKFMRFGDLRVINEDIVQPGMGFGRHPHRDMEIVSYVVEGQLEHKDSMGNGSIIKAGEIQIMTAGAGVEHSEFNHSNTDLLHFLQIWIIPAQLGLAPRYQQISIRPSQNKLVLIGSRDGSDTAVTIHQDIRLYACFLQDNHTLNHTLQQE
ncbi:pirin family protein [Legionella septentrionalis]|uniref:pirin family protein n=1 Tax=Legionella septentrionalis TaxID=2498109 RepID=UPI000F8C721D|nr:pirin-like bicupin family protein [Legionella septentrionalis]RUR09019.1 pirin family protein [Legionella septentrionalis]